MSFGECLYFILSSTFPDEENKYTSQSSSGTCLKLDGTVTFEISEVDMP